MPEKPQRITLSRAKGWRMPPNTVRVDRATKWGNPFVVGQDGTAEECVDLFCKLLGIGICLTVDADIDVQQDARTYIRGNYQTLRGKNLACWCRPGAPCHADVLLELANREEPS
jgi:hypothetical protein